MTKLSSQSLVLVITHQCNLRCLYCPILKKKEKMNFKIAQRAASLFLSFRRDNPRLIRFFGGEPLLNFETIKKTINWIKRNYQGVAFNLTTNGLLLDYKIVTFLKHQPELELIISSNQQKIFQDKVLIEKILELPKVTINFNIWPGKVEQNQKLLSKLLKIGFVRFNFLPAYYTIWEGNEIRTLKKSLKEMAEIIKLSPEKIYLKNLENQSPVPLFNSVPTIDCQGDIYAGNFFLDKRFHFWKSELKIGNISEIRAWESVVESPFVFDFRELIKNIFPKRIIHSTWQVDKALSQFCQLIKNEKS